MEDYTAANIAVSDEKREEELEKTKKGTVDHSQLEEEVAAAKKHAKEVGQQGLCISCHTCWRMAITVGRTELPSASSKCILQFQG